MSGDEDELEQLRQQTDIGTRAQGGGSGDSESADDEQTLENEMVERLNAIDRGDASKTLSLRDGRLAALIQALEEVEELDDVGAALQETAGQEVDADQIDRSEVLRLAVRIGLEEAAPETLESARAAYARHAREGF
jgi:hypothetical protein